MDNTNPTPDETTNTPTGNFNPAPTENVSPEPQTPVAPVVPETPIAAPAEVPQPVVAQAATNEDADHSYLLAVAFSYFFGGLGVDRFYLGYTGLGVLKLLTFGGFGIWHLVDMLLIAFGKKKAKGSNLPLEGYAKHNKPIHMVAIVLLIVNGLVVVGVLIFLLVSVLGAASLQNNARNTQFQYQNQQYQVQQPTGSTYRSN